MSESHGNTMESMQLAKLLFPDTTSALSDIWKHYPPRDLPPGTWITRFAPSPTGFMHIGGIYAALVARKLAHQTGGVFFLRVEDTDKKRELASGLAQIVNTLHYYGLEPDEGVIQIDPIVSRGKYGPYIQSLRMEIYKAFAKDLVARGHAYPCFCSDEELETLRKRQLAGGVKPGYYGEWATHRAVSLETVRWRVAAGHNFAVRFKAPYPALGTIQVEDLVRGVLTLPMNDHDAVLLKSNGLPTYHFAHAVDDSLMGTNLVIRGEEWLSSLPLHVELFEALGQPVPRFGHLAPIAKQEGTSRRKLSKRKDPEAAVAFYAEQGYPREAVIAYLLNLANASFEPWRARHQEASLSSFELQIDHMNNAAPLFDMRKLDDVSKNEIGSLSAQEVCDRTIEWAEENNPHLAQLLRSNPSYAVRVFALERETSTPRKDLARWSQVEDLYGYFFDEVYDQSVSSGFDWPSLPDDKIRAILLRCLASLDEEHIRDTWVSTMRQFSEEIGFARDGKTYQRHPEQYGGQFGDLMMVLRVALTSRRTTPDLFEVISVLGKESASKRIERALRWIDGGSLNHR